jgi:hypothetical protein
LGDLDPVPGLPVGIDDGIDSEVEVGSAVPGREEVDVLARAVEDAMCLDRVPSCEREAELTRCL